MYVLYIHITGTLKKEKKSKKIGWFEESNGRLKIYDT